MLRNTIAGGVPERRAVFTAFVVLACLLVLNFAATDAEARGQSYAPGRILVAPRDGVSPADFDKAVRGRGGKVGRRIRRLDVHEVEVPRWAEKRIAALLAQDPCVKFAELDIAIPLSEVIPNDTYYSNAWHLPKVGAPEAWENSTGSGVTVAVLDTGVDATHSDLSGQLVSGWNTASDNSTTSDVNGHGTMVAGVVAAKSNNSLGVASLAWQAKIMPIRVTDSSDGYAYFSRIATGLTYATDNGAKVANISYNVTGSLSIKSAAEYMQSKGGVVVVAAGNDGNDPGFADSPFMISVAATSSSDTRASWSCYGSYVDVSAPGVGIWTTTMGGGYASVSGTSFSSPVTAGVVALMMAADSSLTPSEIESILEETADDLGSTGWDSYYGYGRINAASAVAAALNSGGGSTDITAPAVSITSPTGGTIYGTTNVYATATDNVGVTKVEFRAGTTLIGTDSTAPFQISWDTTGAADGDVSLTARAYDAAGNATTSAAVSVTVDNVPDADTTAPTVAITSPTGGTVSGTAYLYASASDNVGVTKVEFCVNGTVVGTDNASPYGVSWDTTGAADGSVSLTACAYDAAGNSTTSAAVTLTVDNEEDPAPEPEPGDTKAPTVTISKPADGATVSDRTTIVVSATDDTAVTSLKLYIDGKLVKSSTGGSFSYRWNTRKVSKGTHTIRADATDAAGNKGTRTITVTVE